MASMSTRHGHVVVPSRLCDRVRRLLQHGVASLLAIANGDLSVQDPTQSFLPCGQPQRRSASHISPGEAEALLQGRSRPETVVHTRVPFLVRVHGLCRVGTLCGLAQDVYPSTGWPAQPCRLSCSVTSSCTAAEWPAEPNQSVGLDLQVIPAFKPMVGRCHRRATAAVSSANKAVKH